MSEYKVRVGSAYGSHPPKSYEDLLNLPYDYKEDDGNSIECGTEPWPQNVKCPDCNKAEVVWAEACFVPGHRICHWCGSHWELKGPSDSGREDKQWILRRARFY